MAHSLRRELQASLEPEQPPELVQDLTPEQELVHSEQVLMQAQVPSARPPAQVHSEGPLRVTSEPEPQTPEHSADHRVILEQAQIPELVALEQALALEQELVLQAVVSDY